MLSWAESSSFAAFELLAKFCMKKCSYKKATKPYKQMHKLHYKRNRAHKKLKWLNLVVTRWLHLRRGDRHRIATEICCPVEPSPSSRQQIASKCFSRAGIDADSYLWGFRTVQKLLEKLHNICSSIPFRCCLPSHNLLPTTKRTNSVLLRISSSNELALDEKKEIVFSRSLAIVRLCCGVLRTSSSSADGLPTPSLSLPGTASASSRFAKMRDWLRRLLLPRSCCEEFAQGFRFR